MLLLGYEAEDVLRVIVGITLGLLTVYRRELSCNRGYHPDENDDPLGDSTHHRLMQLQSSVHASHSSSSFQDDNGTADEDSNPTRRIRRRNSSSALPSMASSPNTNNDADSENRRRKNNEDPTEELLESAGLFLSGGPFLAAAIAVFDHLIFSWMIGTYTSMTSLLYAFRQNIGSQDSCRSMCDEEEKVRTQQLLNSASACENEEEDRNQQHLYSVAWNAATEYFTSISAKLDGGGSSGGSPHESTANLQSSYPRSKSMGNLQNGLSDERSRALLCEMVAMAGRGSIDVTLLPSDAQIVVFSYLHPQDVLAFTCTSKAGRNLLEDNHTETTTAIEDNADEGVDIHAKDGDTAVLIWKALFERDYSWVLSDWKIGNEAFLRSMAQYKTEGSQSQEGPTQQQSLVKSGKVLHHLVSTVQGSEHGSNNLTVNSIMAASWSFAATHTTSSMKEFYFTFAETWLNYTIAGCNSTEKCLIGLHGHVFDISNFVEDHPGSTETLLLQAGRDATVFFESMGHSLGARKLALSMCAVVNTQCVRWHFTAEEGSNSQSHFHLVASGPLGGLVSTCGLIKPNDKSLDMKRKIVGFLIPRKRSRPRFRGGLHRVRERLRREEEVQLMHAARWSNHILGSSGMFGGVHVYYDPFRGWRWWYTDRDFQTVYTAPSS